MNADDQRQDGRDQLRESSHTQRHDRSHDERHSTLPWAEKLLYAVFVCCTLFVWCTLLSKHRQRPDHTLQPLQLSDGCNTAS